MSVKRINGGTGVGREQRREGGKRGEAREQWRVRREGAIKEDRERWSQEKG